jgi:hypothetical protein
MAIQLSTTVRTAMAQAVEDTIGTSPILRIRTGAPPTNCAASRTGTVLASMTLPSNWASSSGGALSLSGTWEDLTADATGTAGHYEIMSSDGTVCHVQGTVTGTSPGTGDMVLQQTNADIVSGQRVYVSSWTLTVGGA